MGHTPQQISDAMGKQARLVAFVDATHKGTADLVISAPTGRNNRFAEHSVPRELARPLIQHALDELRALEEEFNFEPWQAPKGVPGKPEKKDGAKDGAK